MLFILHCKGARMWSTSKADDIAALLQEFQMSLIQRDSTISTYRLRLDRPAAPHEYRTPREARERLAVLIAEGDDSTGGER